MSSSSGKRKPESLAHGPTVHAIKRAKYEAKQERQRRSLNQTPQESSAHRWDSWFKGREEYAARVTVEDVREIRRSRAGNGAPSRRCDRLSRIAEWIEPFFDLKEMPIASKEKERSLFIAEGTETVRMMMQRCGTCNVSSSSSKSIHTETDTPPPVRLISILSKPATFFDSPVHLLRDIEKCRSESSPVPPFKILVASEEALSEIAGFPIARGAMACGVIPDFMQTNGYAWLKTLLSREPTPSTMMKTIQQHKPIRKLLALDAISNAANMGSILRTAAAFSIDAIILSDDSCDAWYRQSIRTSMGHVVSVPILRVSDWERGINNDHGGDGYDSKIVGLAGVLRWLREKMSVECFAAVVDGNRKQRSPPLVTLEADHECGCRSWCCVLGNEGHGIREEVIQKCDKRLKIGMASGVDSLSLPIAAGILMHGLGSRSNTETSQRVMKS